MSDKQKRLPEINSNKCITNAFMVLYMMPNILPSF